MSYIFVKAMKIVRIAADCGTKIDLTIAIQIKLKRYRYGRCGIVYFYNKLLKKKILN